MNLHRSLQVLCLTTFGAVCCAGTAGAQTLPKKSGSKAVDWTTKRIVFDMRAKPWASVLEWFADEAHMPLVVGRFRLPEGSFTFVGPKDVNGKPRKYSLVEVFDIINELLMVDHKFALLRRDGTFMLFPADDPGLNYLLPPRIELGHLPQRGNTEIVEVVVGLRKDVDADELARELKRIVGSFGRATPWGDDKLILLGSVPSLRHAIDTISDKLLTLPQVSPPASPPPPATACCGSAPRCRGGLLARLLRR